MRRCISTVLAFALALAVALASAPSALAYSLSPAQMGADRTGAARAASGVYSPHAEQIVAVDGKLYGLVSYARGEFPEPYEYAASEVIEFDSDLKPLRRARLAKGSGASAVAGKNACDMAYADGKLFIPCYGGDQSAGVYGDLWVVDVATMTAAQAIDTKKIAELSSGGMALPYSISISPDGKTAYLLIVTEQGQTSAKAKFYVTTPSDVASGKLPAGSTIDGAGYFWRVARGKDVLWMQAGDSIKVFDADGTDLNVALTEAALGANAYSIAPADDRLFYFASDYASGVIGTVSRSGATFKATQAKPGTTSIGGDALAFAFPGGAAIFEHNGFGYEKDSLCIWSSLDDIASDPAKSGSIPAYNTHSAAAVDSKLYLACYNSGGKNKNRGEFVCVDVSASDFKAAASYLLDVATDGDEPAVQKDPPVVMPSGIKPPSDAAVPTEAAFKSVVTDASAQALVGPDANGVLKLLETKLSELAQAARNDGLIADDRTTDEIALPIVSADVTSGAVSVITISPVTLSAEDAGSVSLIKVKSPTDLLSYELVERSPDFGDGKFAILRGDTIIKSTDEISSDDKYTICVFIKDGGGYDLNGAEGVILDPMMIVTYESGGGGSGGSGGQGSGGSCSTGAAVVLSAAALALSRRRR